MSLNENMYKYIKKNTRDCTYIASEGSEKTTSERTLSEREGIVLSTSWEIWVGHLFFSYKDGFFYICFAARCLPAMPCEERRALYLRANNHSIGSAVTTCK